MMNLDAEKEYLKMVEALEATGKAKASKMFGMPCLKNEKGKAFAGYHKGEVNFKLPPETVKGWIGQPDIKLFDPGMGRPMKEWIVVPVEYAHHWVELAKEGLEYVTKQA